MDEILPPVYLPPPAPRPSFGCFAKGCLTVAVVGIILGFMFGYLGWHLARGMQPYVSQQPVSIRVRPVTELEYQAVEAKISVFALAVNGGHHATLTLTADELNILVARDPRYASLRGRAYFEIIHNQISAETSTVLNDHASESQRLYFHGRVVFDASFSSGDFTVVLRRLEPLGGGPTPPMVAWALNQPGSSNNFNDLFNENFHEILRQNPGSTDFFDRLHTIIVQDDQLVVTALDGPGAVAGGADQR